MDDLDTCERRRDEAEAAVQRISHMALAEFMLSSSYFQNIKRDRRRAVKDIQQVQRIKARCVYTAIGDRVGALVMLSDLENLQTGRVILGQLALFEGLRRSSSPNDQGRCLLVHSILNDQLECARGMVAREIRRQAVLAAIESFFADLNRAVKLKSAVTLSEIIP